MTYVLLGAAGLLLQRLFDLLSLARIRWLKPLVWLAGSLLLIYAAVMTTATGSRLDLPDWLAWAGSLLLAAALASLIYSLFFALPFKQTYIDSGTSQLIAVGLYRLVRHPWLVFFSLSLAGLTLVSRSGLSALAAVAWTALAIPLVFLQDRFILGRLLPGYDDYRRRTPMFWPTRESIRLFIAQYKNKSALTGGDL